MVLSGFNGGHGQWWFMVNSGYDDCFGANTAYNDFFSGL